MNKNKERGLFVKQRNRRDKKLKKASKYPNGRAIQDLMLEQRIKGDYRDYIVLNEDSMLDYRGTYNISYTNAPDFGKDEFFIIHKKELHKLIGEKSLDFWHPIIGRLIAVPPRTKGKKDEN